MAGEGGGTSTAPSTGGGSARSWKMATMALGATTVALAVLLVLQASGRFSLGGLVGGGAGFAGGAAAPVKLGEFKGDPALVSLARDIATKRMSSAGALHYSSPGVTGVVVGGNVTTKPSGGDINVKVSLYVTKEPGAGLLSVLSAAAAVSPGDEKDAVDAAVNSVMDDLPGALAGK
jgi:hypothetical protein